MNLLYRTLSAICGLTLIFSQLVTAQITQGGEPLGKLKSIPILEVPLVQMPEVDVEKLKTEDSQRAKLGKEFNRRFGFTHNVTFSLENSGAWLQLSNGDRVWQLMIKAPKAQTINLTFSKYYLPAGATLFLIGKQNTIGALTNFNNQADEKLGTGLIQGEWVQLEYFEPASVRGLGKLAVGNVTHGYKNPFSILGWDESDACEMNVNCPMGEPWQNEKRSVARIIDNGDVCTGALVNNVLQDGTPYFLTANHCYSTTSTTWVFSFNWESPTCITPTSPIPENQTISGSTLKSRLAASDFCLFELSSKPPASFKSYYSGWSALDVPSINSTIIHHPAGDIKKISFDTEPSISSGYGSGSANNNSHWRIDNYEFATTTEGGSSGSPMFDQNHRIVGQLHGGTASCNSITSDFYGKVSRSWNDGTTPATRLKDWLDPLNSGLLVMDGYDPACMRLAVNLPYQPNIDTVLKPLPYLWKVKNPNADSTFRLVEGGFDNQSGKGFRMVSDQFNPVGRGDTLVLSPVTVSKYKNIRFNFHYAYRRTGLTVSDTMHLLVSQNCGSTFSQVGEWSGNSFPTDASLNTTPFTPVDTTLWKKIEVALDSTYNRAQQLVFAFGFTSGNAGTLWLDQFRIIGDTAKNKPFSRFESDKKFGCAGSQIQFSDSSLFNPTSLTWSFEGGIPATSTESSPTVTYLNEGSYKVTLISKNEEGSDTLVKLNYVQIYQLGQITTPFIQNFSGSGNFPPAGYILLNPENNRTWVQNDAVSAPGSTGGSLMFDNYSSPNATGTRDWIYFPKISTAGKSHLKVRFKMAYKAYSSFGFTSPDSLLIGYTTSCGGEFKSFWKKGAIELSTAGTQTSMYTPVSSDWAMVQLNLDSLLYLPELSIGFQNYFGYGNRLFIDDIFIDTIDNCPSAPVVTVNSDSICIGKTLVMSMDSLDEAIYSWTGPANFTSSNRTISRLITALNQGGLYKGTVSKFSCTSPVTSQQVFAFNNPAIPTFTQTGNTLTGPAGMANYIWIVNGTDTLNEYTRSITAPYSGSYVLVVTNPGGCSNISNPVEVVVVSVNSRLEASGILIYPNPAVERLFIQKKSGSDFQLVGIFNTIGQSISSEVKTNPILDGLELQVSNLQPGTYWLKFSNKQGVFVLPFQKSK